MWERSLAWPQIWMCVLQWSCFHCLYGMHMCLNFATVPRKSTQSFHFFCLSWVIRTGTSPELRGSCPHISMYTVTPANSPSLFPSSLCLEKLLLGSTWQYLTTWYSIRPRLKGECRLCVPLLSICTAHPSHSDHPWCARCPSQARSFPSSSAMGRKCIGEWEFWWARMCPAVLSAVSQDLGGRGLPWGSHHLLSPYFPASVWVSPPHILWSRRV